MPAVVESRFQRSRLATSIPLRRSAAVLTGSPAGSIVTPKPMRTTPQFIDTSTLKLSPRLKGAKYLVQNFTGFTAGEVTEVERLVAGAIHSLCRQPGFKDSIPRDTRLQIADITQVRTTKLAIHSRLRILKIMPLIHRPALLNP